MNEEETVEYDDDLDGLNHGPRLDTLNRMGRSKDDLRILVAQLAGAAWRTAMKDRALALAELDRLASQRPKLAAQAAADASRHWRDRANNEVVDIKRTTAAADNLAQLARDIAGHDVEPSPQETNVTVDPKLMRGRI